ncbi:hypothetical protein G8770_16875 [Aestuariicella hydrocarbonica]|uniref:Uncharacterized protein n=1 Tax=Pseudomaricurvus hydrocarbonicus TaxID=1470433 RepID=A0A9E5MMY8_9GAMM|nr:hypothetical protein [Aestuariicella hydrocarbonica]NHO67224.1 hypothetical protein [Aestuariicella hydrocarbonica]
MSLDYLQLAGTKAKGKRPQFFADSDNERLLSILMAVAGELAVTRERLDTLERLLEAKGLLSQDEIETFTPDSDQAEARGLLQQEYIARILRVVQQEKEALEEQQHCQSNNDLSEIEQELSRI